MRRSIAIIGAGIGAEHLAACLRLPERYAVHSLCDLDPERGATVAARHPGVTATTDFDAILSDLNGPAEDSIRHVIRISEYLREHGLVVFTLKLPHTENIAAPTDLYRSIIRTTAEAGLRLIAKTHLTYNRNELTLFFEYKPF